MSRFLAVKNFESFQHYKDRNPVWIKLYNELLEDYEFASLPDNVKGQLICIWLLASRMDNRIPHDAKWIGNKINASTPVDIDLLIDAGFLLPHEPEQAKGKREEWASRYISEGLRAEVLDRDGHACKWCAAGDNLEIDHIVPISKGGTGAKENLQVLCRACNRSKRAKSVEQLATQMRSPEREREKNPPIVPPDNQDSDFDEWWGYVPAKKSRAAALRAYRTARKKVGQDVLVAGVKRYAAEMAGQDPRFIKHPSTWLNGECWNDEPVAQPRRVVGGL